MIDSAGEGEVDAADKLSVEETSENQFRLFIVVVIVKCVGRESGYLKVWFVDDRAAVHDHSLSQLSKSCVLSVNFNRNRSQPQLSSAPQRSAQEGTA